MCRTAWQGLSQIHLDSHIYLQSESSCIGFPLNIDASSKLLYWFISSYKLELLGISHLFSSPDIVSIKLAAPKLMVFCLLSLSLPHPYTSPPNNSVPALLSMLQRFGMIYQLRFVPPLLCYPSDTNSKPTCLERHTLRNLFHPPITLLRGADLACPWTCDFTINESC